MYTAAFYIFVFLFGSIIGSFLNVCIYRIPRGLSIVFPSSKCPSCNNPIKPRDNIPILSYLLLKGKCRICHTGIPFRYPLVELINALLYVMVLMRFGPHFSWFLIVYFVLVSSLVVITFIDLDFQIIPNSITLPGIPLALILGSMLLPDPFARTEPMGFKASAVGVLFGGGLFYGIGILGSLVFKKEAMGGGDIKMMSMLGGVLGWKGIILTTFISSLVGSLVGISLIISKGGKVSTKIPFGPYLALGALFSLFLGQEILIWFLPWFFHMR
jgi:leader peptidase (prepilin peptidase)/N-methyltransferase